MTHFTNPASLAGFSSVSATTHPFLFAQIGYDLLQTPCTSHFAMMHCAMQRLREVFNKMDRNHDGVLNIAEFREAMDALDEHLNGAMVAEVCGALDIHGRVDFDQFRDIVEVECMRSRTQETEELRTLLHDHSADHFKDWLDSWG